MATADVIQCLQALDVPSLGLSAGEKKARLKGEIGAAVAREEVGGGGGGKEGSGSGVGGGKDGGNGKGKEQTPADKARTNTENAKKAAEVRKKVLEAKRVREEKLAKK